MAPREPAALPYPQYPAQNPFSTGTIPAQTGSFPAPAGVTQTGTVPTQTGSFPTQPVASQTGAIPGLPQLSTQISPAADPIITVRGLRKTYESPGGDPVVALDNISIDFPRGQFTAIMGPSGSGKSSLLHCIVGLDSFQEGIVKVAGKNLATMSSVELTEFRRVTVGFIFQSYNLIPTLRARENIEIAAELQRHQIDRKHFKDLVKRLDLGKCLNVFPSRLSGGQQQKVACARALLTRPAVVVADEPTGGLDSESAAEVLAFLRGAASDWGQSVIMVTHEPDAAQYASRVLFLRDGRLVAQLTNPTREAILEAQQALGQLRSGASDGSVGLDTGSLGAISMGLAGTPMSTSRDFMVGGSTGVEPLDNSASSVPTDVPESQSAHSELGTPLGIPPVAATGSTGLPGGTSAALAGVSGAPKPQNSPWLPVKSGGFAAAATIESDEDTAASSAGFGSGFEPGSELGTRGVPAKPVNNPLADSTTGLAAIAVNAGNSLAPHEAETSTAAPATSQTSQKNPDEKPKNRRSSWRNRKKRRPVADPALAQTFATLGVAVPEPEPNELADSLATGQFKWPSLSEASPDLDEGDSELLGTPLGLFARRPAPAAPRPPVPPAPAAPPTPATPGQLTGLTATPEVPAQPTTPAAPVTPAVPNPAVPLVTSAFTVTASTGGSPEPDLTTPNVPLTDATQTGVGFLRRVAEPGYGFVPDDSAAPGDSVAPAAVDAPAALGAIPDASSTGITPSQNPVSTAIPGQTEPGSEVPGWARQLAPAAAEPGFESGSSLAASGWALTDTGQARPVPSPSAAGAAAANTRAGAVVAPGRVGAGAGGVGAGQLGLNPGAVVSRPAGGVSAGQPRLNNPAAGQAGLNSGVASAAVGTGSAAVGAGSGVAPGRVGAGIAGVAAVQSGFAVRSVDSLAPHEAGATPGRDATATTAMPAATPTAASGAAGVSETGTEPPRETPREDAGADENLDETSRPRRRRRATVDPQEAELAGQNELLQMIAQAEKLLAASGAAISDAQDALTRPEKPGKSKETGADAGASNASNASSTGTKFGTAAGSLGSAGGKFGAGGGTRGQVDPAKRGVGAPGQGDSAALGASSGSSVSRGATAPIHRPSTSTFTSVKGNASLAELAHSLGLEDIITAGRDRSGDGSDSGSDNFNGGLGFPASPGSPVPTPAAPAVPAAPTTPAAPSGFRSFMAGASGQPQAGDSGSTRGTTPDQDLLIARADAMLAQANAQSLDLQRSLLNLENPGGSPSKYRDAARMAPHENEIQNPNPANARTTDPKGR